MPEMRQLIERPVGGVMEGIDATLIPGKCLTDARNVRVSEGVIQPRLGTALSGDQLPAGASGTVQALASIYTADGERYRLAARGGKVYLKREATGAVFTEVPTATGIHATNRLRGVTAKGKYYYTDQSGALRKITPQAASPFGVSAAVTQPAAPSSAPLVTKRHLRELESWTGNFATSTYWEASRPGDLDRALSPRVFPITGNAAKFILDDGDDTEGATLTQNVSDEEVYSNQLAFYLRQSDTNHAYLTMELGVNSAVDFREEIWPKSADQPSLIFVNVGAIDKLNYKRFRRTATSKAGRNLHISPMLLTGRLQGKYRWRYTHYCSDTALGPMESKPGPATEVIDFSQIGVSRHNETSAALTKCAGLRLPTDRPTVTTTDKIRIYRNGGAPSLSADSAGQDVWVRVAEIPDYATTLAAAVLAGAESITVPTNDAIKKEMWLILDPGVQGKEEWVYVVDRTAGETNDTLSLKWGLAPLNVTTGKNGCRYAHNQGAAVEVGYVDNVPDNLLPSENRIDLERDDPPAGIRQLAVAGDGRLWAFGYGSEPNGVAVSNMPTVLRPTDQEVFPAGVDPLIRQSITQGWRFQVPIDGTGDPIQWGGFFQRFPIIFTRNAMYRVHAYSQLDWGSTAVQKIIEVGCLCPESVCEVNGRLYWVAEGPCVMCYDGQNITNLSHLRVNRRLKAAPREYWGQWFALSHRRQGGAYYCLYYTPAGATTNIEHLDYNVDADTWEPIRDVAGVAADVRCGGTDSNELFVLAAAGALYQLETGATDPGAAGVPFYATTKRYPLAGGMIGRLIDSYLRLERTSADQLSVSVKVGGSEYGNATDSIADIAVSAAAEEALDLHLKWKANLIGRWVQFTLSGTVKETPAISELEWRASVMRAGSVQS